MPVPSYSFRSTFNSDVNLSVFMNVYHCQAYIRDFWDFTDFLSKSSKTFGVSAGT